MRREQSPEKLSKIGFRVRERERRSPFCTEDHPSERCDMVTGFCCWRKQLARLLTSLVTVFSDTLSWHCRGQRPETGLCHLHVTVTATMWQSIALYTECLKLSLLLPLMREWYPKMVPKYAEGWSLPHHDLRRSLVIYSLCHNIVSWRWWSVIDTRGWYILNVVDLLQVFYT